MKKLLLSISLIALALNVSAQSVAIRIIANDGSVNSTNNITLPAHVVSGLIAAWQDDSRAKTNASPPTAALKLSAFVAQEIGDKSRAEWEVRGNKEAAIAFFAANGGASLTNDIPPRLITAWPNLTGTQRLNAVQHLLLLSN